MTIQRPRLLAGFLAFSTLTLIAAARGDEKPRLDRGKRVIEKPTETVIAARSGTVSVTGKLVNPKVEPGKVKWHPTFAAACAAAQRSHNPVLLFQMMGKLDEQFC